MNGIFDKTYYTNYLARIIEKFANKLSIANDEFYPAPDLLNKIRIKNANVYNAIQEYNSAINDWYKATAGSDVNHNVVDNHTLQLIQNKDILRKKLVFIYNSINE